MKSLAVASRSFSKNIVLRNKVLKLYPDTKFNDGGHSLNGDSLVHQLNCLQCACGSVHLLTYDFPLHFSYFQNEVVLARLLNGDSLGHGLNSFQIEFG